ncbi:MAG: (2Fe-2S) ferredoxin domain-containing protein [Rhodospirillaceae bacterium]|jgi:(2Fe-2S) ferredoxin|nr:(2Fe-2S) ferredoxin domain-containing protein [Rhodospirillaceae bacterium]
MSGNQDPAPYYQCHVFCCTNERPADHPRGCCAGGQSVKLRTYLKNRAQQADVADIRVNSSGCLDRCELGPVMVIYPEGIWYRYDNRQDIDEILETHILKGGRVARLMLTPEDGPDPA